MPSAEETTYLIEVMPDTTSLNQDFGSRDVDVLVSRIKENLRLTSLKSRSSLARKMRPSPYSLPSSRSWYESDVCELCSVLSNSFSESSQEQQQQQQQHQHSHLHHAKRCRRRRDRRGDYERFKALLKKGALIKEAVKRLHVEAIDDTSYCTSEDEKSRKGGTTDDNSEDEASSVAGDDFYRRKHFDYDDEDEPLLYHHDIFLDGELE